MEAVFARGDRRLGPVLKRAWRLGARFDGWTERFRADLWEQAFREEGVDPRYYADRERPLDEVLPWDHLSARVEKAYLRSELELALRGEYTPDCRWAPCAACGACDHTKIRPVLHNETDWKPVEGLELRDHHSAAVGKEFLYWVRYSKVGNMRFLGQLDIAQVLARAIRRAGIPIAFSSGFHPHPKVSFVEALPLGFESLWEEVNLSLTEEVGSEVIGQSLNAQLPEGLAVLDVARVNRRAASPEGRVMVYRISEVSPVHQDKLLTTWRQRLDEPLRKKTKKGWAESPLGDVLMPSCSICLGNPSTGVRNAGFARCLHIRCRRLRSDPPPRGHERGGFSECLPKSSSIVIFMKRAWPWSKMARSPSFMWNELPTGE
jgi:radical SAM-linked protein